MSPVDFSSKLNPFSLFIFLFLNQFFLHVLKINCFKTPLDNSKNENELAMSYLARISKPYRRITKTAKPHRSQGPLCSCTHDSEKGEFF